MKIRLFLLIGSCAMQAMDIVPLLEDKKNKQPLQIKTIQDIPKISFENIELCFLGLLANKRFDLWKEKNKKGTCLADSLIFNVALLPHDVRLKIVRLMFVGDEQSAEKFYRTPLLYACKRYQDTISAVLHSSLGMEELEKSIAIFFRLPVKKQNIIMPIINQSLIARINHDGLIISKKTLRFIENDLLVKKFFEGQTVDLVATSEEENPACEYVAKSLVVTLASVVPLMMVSFAGTAFWIRYTTPTCMKLPNDFCLEQKNHYFDEDFNAIWKTLTVCIIVCWAVITPILWTRLLTQKTII